MITPKPRKLKHRSHKNFGSHSRIVDGLGIKPEDAGGRSVGSKQICPGEYGTRQTGGGGDYRSKAEKLNDAQRNHDHET